MGSERRAVRDRARGVGADGHLIKPFESRTLVERVEALLAAPPRAMPPQAPAPVPAAPEPAPEPVAELEGVLDDLAGAAPEDGAPADEDEIETLLDEEPADAPLPGALSEEDVRRVARLVVSQLAEQIVRVAGRAYSFARGERIHTENSHKYSVEEFQALARAGGWQPVMAWTDPDRLFSLHLLRV